MLDQLHPQLKAMLGRIAEAGYPDQIAVPVDEARRITVERARRYYGDPVPVHRVEPLTVAGAAGPLAARLYAAKSDEPLPIVVYFHGGGWVLGDIDSHDKGVRAITDAARCMSISIDYRRAPEHPFPAAAEDCFAALCWIAENAASLGGDPRRIAVAGDSAGGNLAAVCALMARDAGGPALAFQLLIYPVVDSDIDGGTYATLGDAPVLNRDRMAYFWNLYVPDASARGDWRCAPLRAADHARLPPALVIGAGIDPLYGEGLAYVDALCGAGVAAEHVAFPRMTHAFFQAPAILDDARAAVDASAAALRRAFGTGAADTARASR